MTKVRLLVKVLCEERIDIHMSPKSRRAISSLKRLTEPYKYTRRLLHPLYRKERKKAEYYLDFIKVIIHPDTPSVVRKNLLALIESRV